MSGLGIRVVGALAVAVGVGTAIWFASSWIDRAPDATCGSLWRSDLWADQSTCQAPMRFRGLVGLGLVATAGWLSYRLFGRADRRALVVAVALVATSFVVLIVNEVVRSGGSLAS